MITFRLMFKGNNHTPVVAVVILINLRNKVLFLKAAVAMVSQVLTNVQDLTVERYQSGEGSE